MVLARQLFDSNRFVSQLSSYAEIELQIQPTMHSKQRLEMI